MILIVALLTAIGAPADTCSVARVGPQVTKAATALAKPDLSAARAAIDTVATCPAANGATFAAHVLSADIAVREGDGATARAALNGVAVHPEVTLSAVAESLRLRADRGLGDEAAFTADRAAVIAANDGRLAAIGKRIETFRAGAFQVTAYDAVVDQGAFHRVLEFIALPDDGKAYPVSILLTDDREAAKMMEQVNKVGSTAHAWFVDLYTCSAHSSLPPVGPPDGDQPTYAAVKAEVVRELAAARGLDSPQPERDHCRSTGWILPGLGAKLPPTVNP